MARVSRLSKLVSEALTILSALGIPTSGMTWRRQEKMAKAFLAVAAMTPASRWADARSNNRLRSRDVIDWMNEHLDENISSGSYDDIRRKDLKLLVEAGLVLKSAGKDGAATNDGTRPYALSSETAQLLHFYGTPEWDAKLAVFTINRVNLAKELQKLRLKHPIPITIGDEQLLFGPGEHNLLQKAIIEDFLPCFGQGAQVLYLGDTEDKLQFLKSELLKDLGFFELAHDELPDVLAYSHSMNWLFVIEAVHSANPISELRKRTLEKLTEPCTADIVYVTAFLTRDAFRRFSSQIAWETEVWIAEAPQHLIHFNGDKFMGPHKPQST
jgi:hypothetical protein